MICSGLVSVTFRKLSPREILDLVSRARLEGVEWGGDVHVPHGATARAAEVAEMTRQAGLAVTSYGSYYRAAASEAAGLAFSRVLETALALGAPVVRVWAGDRGSAAADGTYRAAVVADARRIAGMAGAAGVRVAFEYHGGTLTDTNASALALLEGVDHPNVRCYWQPALPESEAERRTGLSALLPYLANLHVFQWDAPAPRTIDRRPLAEGAGAWADYLALAGGAQGDRWALLEFVRDDSAEQFLGDAATLRRWLHPDQ